MWGLMRYLIAADELVKDKSSLRHMGLSEEELVGYEEFFFREYFPANQEEI